VEGCPGLSSEGRIGTARYSYPHRMLDRQVLVPKVNAVGASNRLSTAPEFYSDRPFAIHISNSILSARSAHTLYVRRQAK
jgi:hypothetical protein